MRISFLLILFTLFCLPFNAIGQTAETSNDTPSLPDIQKEFSRPPARSIDPPVSEIVVLPETVKAIEMDNVDFNRIQCPGIISDIVVSKERHVVSQWKGNNGFVKFQHMIKDGKAIYQTSPVEMHVICDDEVYSIIGVPTTLQSSPVIRLAGGNKKKIKQNASLFGGMPLIKKCIHFVTLAYKDNLPQSFDDSRVNQPVDLYKGLKLVLTDVIRATGQGLQLKEYAVSNITKDETLRITEKSFLKTELTTNTQFISIGPPKYNLKPGDSVRVFIVERTGGGS